MCIIWCIVPEIKSTKDGMFCHFGPFCVLLPKKRKNAWRYHFTKMHQKSWLYVLNCSSMYDECNFYFLFWAIFHLQLNILDVCYTNNHHMMYHSWDMVRKQKRDRQMDRWTDRHMEKVTYRGGCLSKNGWICSR